MMKSPTRRSVLSQAAAGAAVIASGAASAQPAPAAREKGPLVWLEHGPEGARRRLRPGGLCAEPRHRHQALHSQQRAGARAPRRAEAFLLRSDLVRGARRVHRQAPERADHDLHPRRRMARRQASQYHYLAELFLNAGAQYRRAGLHQCRRRRRQPAAMADQIRRSVAWVYKNAKSFGGDPERIYVSGQSSGGASGPACC